MSTKKEIIRKIKLALARIKPLTIPWGSSAYPTAPRIQVILSLFILGFYNVFLLERENGSKLIYPKCNDTWDPAGGDTSYDVLPHSIYRRIVIKTIPTYVEKLM
jgi:hypothetical protein